MKKIVAILICICTLCSLAMPAAAFGDMESHWARDYVDRWAGYGIVNGIGGDFQPEGELTRAQAAKILVGLLKEPLTDYSGDYRDVAAEDWHAPYIATAVKLGILNGKGDGVMDPDGIVDRQTMMVMFGRALGIQEETALAGSFSDAEQIQPWARGYVYALVNQGYVSGVGDDLLAPEASMNRGSTMALLGKTIPLYIHQPGSYEIAEESGIVLVACDEVILTGTAVNVLVSGDNVQVNTQDTCLTVREGAEGVTENGRAVAGGTTVTTTVPEQIPPETEPETPADPGKKTMQIRSVNLMTSLGEQDFPEIYKNNRLATLTFDPEENLITIYASLKQLKPESTYLDTELLKQYKVWFRAADRWLVWYVDNGIPTREISFNGNDPLNGMTLEDEEFFIRGETGREPAGLTIWMGAEDLYDWCYPDKVHYMTFDAAGYNQLKFGVRFVNLDETENAWNQAWWAMAAALEGSSLAPDRMAKDFSVAERYLLKLDARQAVPDVQTLAEAMERALQEHFQGRLTLSGAVLYENGVLDQAVLKQALFAQLDPEEEPEEVLKDSGLYACHSLEATASANEEDYTFTLTLAIQAGSAQEAQTYGKALAQLGE